MVRELPNGKKTSKLRREIGSLAGFSTKYSENGEKEGGRMQVNIRQIYRCNLKGFSISVYIKESTLIRLS